MMEGDDISTRIADDRFPKTILVQKPSRPIDFVDWDKVIGKPRLSWWARARRNWIAAWRGFWR